MDLDFSPQEKVLPYSRLGERMLLGAILTDSEAIGTVAKYLDINAFFVEQHQILYKAALELYKAGKTVDFVNIVNWIEDNKLVNYFEDTTFISNLINETIYTVYLHDYIAVVQEKYLRRLLLDLGQEIIDYAYLTEKPVEELFSHIEQKVLSLTQDTERKDFGRTSEILTEILSNIRKQLKNPDFVGLLSGFFEVDALTQGFQKSDLIIIAGRPSMGKTAFVLNIARNIALQFNTQIAFFSLELSSQQLIYRLLSTETLIPQSRLKSGKLSKNEWVTVNKSAQKLSNLPLFIDDTPDLSINDLQIKIKQLKRTHATELGLIVIDYLQLLDSTKDESRVQELSKITRSLKKLARTLNLPIVVLSQLSRSVETRPNKRPILSDLRDSGSIEQDADVVMMLYRDDYYHSNTEQKNVMEVIIAKQRNGPVGTAMIGFDETQHLLFSDLT